MIKKTTCSLVLFSIFITAFAQPKDSVELSNYIKQYGAFLVSMPQPSKTEVQEKTDQSFIPPKNINEQTIAKHLKVFENSFYFYVFGQSKEIAKAISLSYGEHLLPNYLLLNKTDTINTPIVKNVITKKGVNIFKNEKDNSLFPGDIPISLTPIEDIDYAEGSIHLKIPTEYKTLKIQLNNLNETVSAEGISVKATEQNNDVVTLHASAGLPLEYFIKAKNKSDNFLISNEITTLPETLYNNYIQNKNVISNEIIKDYILNSKKYDSEAKIISIKSSGIATSIVIYIPVAFFEKKIKFKVLPKPDFFSEEITVGRNQYEKPESPVVYKTISKSELQQNINPKADRSQALLMGFNNHMVTIQLPAIGNSKFAKIDINDEAVYKNNKLVKFKGQGPFLNNQNYSCSYRFEEDVPWGKKSNPLEIDTMKGEFIIDYPLNVRQIKIRRSEEKSNHNYFPNDNTVKFHWKDADSIRTDAITIKAYNNEFDYPLESMNSTTVGNFELDGEYVNFLENKFRGKVDYFTVDIAEQYTTLIVPFSLAPIPARKQPQFPIENE